MTLALIHVSHSLFSLVERQIPEGPGKTFTLPFSRRRQKTQQENSSRGLLALKVERNGDITLTRHQFYFSTAKHK